MFELKIICGDNSFNSYAFSNMTIKGYNQFLTILLRSCFNYQLLFVNTPQLVPYLYISVVSKRFPANAHADKSLFRCNVHVVVTTVIVKPTLFDNEDILRKYRERFICYIYIKHKERNPIVFT